MEIVSRIIPAKPRNKELYFSKEFGGSSYVSSVSTSGSSSSGSLNYWELITTDENGNPLTEAYLKTIYPVVSENEITAFGAGSSSGYGANYSRLDDWLSYSEENAGWVLSALLGKDLLDKVTQLETKDSDKHFETTVNMPALVWEISHNLNKYPAVTVINNDSQIVEGDVKYIDSNTLTITFSAEFSGKVICN